MSFLDFDPQRTTHLLKQLQTKPDLRADALFERHRELRLCRDAPQAGGAADHRRPPPVTAREEEGFAVRLRSAARSWTQSRDQLDGEAFTEALRRVARSRSSLPLPTLRFGRSEWTDDQPVLTGLARSIERLVRTSHAAFPFTVELTHHQRQLVVVGPSILAEPQAETFFSFRATMEGQVLGGLLPVDEQAEPGSVEERLADHIARRMLARFRARKADDIHPGECAVVLGPDAAAVFLHEAVAHALEVDLLATQGDPRAVVGLRLGNSLLNVTDDPAGAPACVARTHDDEGSPTQRRWLLREGKIAQLIADATWSERVAIDPGCGRRANRHSDVAPRSAFLELLPGSATPAELFEREGIWCDQIESGRLERNGHVTLRFAHGRRFTGGEFAQRVGPFELTGRIADLLDAVSMVGDDVREGGAGWCAKAGQRLPVWARAPSLRIERAEVRPR